MDIETQARETLVQAAKLLAQEGLVAGTDGNLSARLDGGRFLLTPSGVRKDALSPDDLLVVDAAGRKLTGAKKPTSEVFMHLKAYELRPEVHAVVHAHPQHVAALTAAGLTDINFRLPEMVLYLGMVPVTAYATPTTLQGPEVLAPFLTESDAFILPLHGSVTLGEDMMAAVSRLEALEHTCEILYAAALLRSGKLPERLPETEIARLWEIHSRSCVRPKPLPCL